MIRIIIVQEAKTLRNFEKEKNNAFVVKPKKNTILIL